MSKELKTGIIAILIIIAFVWGYNFLKGHDIFQPNYRTFIVEYNNVGGLNEASIVTINGLKVGQVEEIDFNDQLDKRGNLVVEFSLDNDFEFSKSSVVKIYSPNPLAGSSLAIIPDYNGELAVSGDTLVGVIEAGLFTSIGQKLDPIQTKLEKVIVSADTLFQRINHLLDDKTTESLQSSVKNVEYTLVDLRKGINAMNSLIDSTSEGLTSTIRNTEKITENMAKVSDSLAQINITELSQKAEEMLTSVNAMINNINEGNGTLGKLAVDEALYDNLTAMSSELEQLLRDMKLNPKRFVHFSLFGKKQKPYKPEEKKNNEVETSN